LKDTLRRALARRDAGGRIVRGVLYLLVVTAFAACAKQHDKLDLSGKDVKLTFLHTSDMHSRLFPFRMKVI
jgi:hypothetical protein